MRIPLVMLLSQLLSKYIAVSKGWSLRQLDVQMLHRILEVYMEQSLVIRIILHTYGYI